MELRGKTIVVTGAAGGIGKGLEERFARENTTVVCTDIDRVGADALAQSTSCIPKF